MNILHLISSSGMYGAERMIVTLSEALLASGHQSAVAAFENKHNPNVEVLVEARRRGLTTESLHSGGRLDPRTVLGIRRMLAKHCPDVLHTHGYKADVVGYLAARGSKAKLVSTCHNWLEDDIAVVIYGKVDRLVLRSFSMTVAVSGSVAGRLRAAGVPESRIRLIDNGIDVSQFVGASATLRSELPNARCVVGVVARLAPEKGIHNLLRAAAMLRQRINDVIYVIVGEGPQRAELESLADQLDLRDTAFFVDRRDDMAGVYASLDILVQPSLDEGLPMTLLEALAASRAVVATDVGAVGSVIINRETGLLIPPGSPEALAEAIGRLVSDEKLQRQFGSAGQRLIKSRFSATRMAEEYSEIYKHVTSGSAAV